MVRGLIVLISVRRMRLGLFLVWGIYRFKRGVLVINILGFSVEFEFEEG